MPDEPQITCTHEGCDKPSVYPPYNLCRRHDLERRAAEAANAEPDADAGETMGDKFTAAREVAHPEGDPGTAPPDAVTS